nr:hypothetical protein [uncultured Carboxylicivirga sp.]
MKTFKLKVIGTPEEVNSFTNFLPQRTIDSMTGLFKNNDDSNVHRFINLRSKDYLEIGDLVKKVQEAAREMEVVK